MKTGIWKVRFAVEGSGTGQWSVVSTEEDVALSLHSSREEAIHEARQLGPAVAIDQHIEELDDGRWSRRDYNRLDYQTRDIHATLQDAAYYAGLERKTALVVHADGEAELLVPQERPPPAEN